MPRTGIALSEKQEALAQAAAALLDEFRDPASDAVIDVGCDAAHEAEQDGHAGNANDCVEAFLAAIAALRDYSAYPETAPPADNPPQRSE